jgi:hypothetical protein
MKTQKKLLVFFVVLFLFSGSQIFSEVQLDKLRDTVDAFTDNLAQSLPFNASLGLNWSDAYIKKFPHFGTGISVGFTTMNAQYLEDLMGQFGFSIPGMLDGFGGFPLPGYTVEGRFGGLALPFDIGFKFGYMPMKLSDINLNYFLAGGDIRYAILEKNILLPSVSFGVGFNYLSGKIGKAIGSEMQFGYNDVNENPQALIVERPDVNLNWSTATVDIKAQISKSVAIVTPYLGIGASHGWSKAGYSVDATVSDTGDNIDTAKEIFEQFGIDGIDSNGFSSQKKINGWSARVFGGLSFNILILRIDLTGLYNILSKDYGASLGFRIQF